MFNSFCIDVLSLSCHCAFISFLLPFVSHLFPNRFLNFAVSLFDFEVIACHVPFMLLKAKAFSLSTFPVILQNPDAQTCTNTHKMTPCHQAKNQPHPQTLRFSQEHIGYVGNADLTNCNLHFVNIQKPSEFTRNWDVPLNNLPFCILYERKMAGTKKQNERNMKARRSPSPYVCFDVIWCFLWTCPSLKMVPAAGAICETVQFFVLSLWW